MLLPQKIPTINKSLSFSALKIDKFKSSVITFTLTVPLTKEAATFNLLLSGLLRRGTVKLPSLSVLNRTLDELYGSYVEIRSSHTGNNLLIVFTAEVLDNKYIPDGTDVLGGVIDIISDLILCPAFTTKSFDKNAFLQEKRIIEDNIAAAKNNTRAYSVKRCSELISEQVSPAPTYSEIIDMLSNISYADVVEYYNSTLSKAPIDVFYIGSSTPESVCAKLEQAFSDIKDRSPAYSVEPLVPYKRSEPISVSEPMSVSQGKLALGFSTGVTISPCDDSYYTALMLNEIFGGSPSSKLFLNVREKMSLCYYCSSSLSIYTGAIMVSSGIDITKLELVKDAVLEQLEEIKRGNVSITELDAAKRSLENSYRQLYDSPLDIQSFYSGRAMVGVSDTIDTCIDKILAVNLDDIVRLANKISLDATFVIESLLTDSCDDMEEDGLND